VLPTTVSAIAGIALVLLIFTYALIETDATKRRMKHSLGEGNPNLLRLREFVDVVGDAMIARAILGLAAATGDGILLLVLGVPQVGLWVVISFICSFIPYIGYWLALVPPLIVALATQGFGTAVIVFFGYWVINGFFDSIIGPKFQGNKLNLSPVVTMISVMFWGSMFGAIGGMMALPLTLGIKILLLDAFPESRWLSLAIESDYKEPESQTAPEKT
jgi:AI-2 transport protein TqsA